MRIRRGKASAEQQLERIRVAWRLFVRQSREAEQRGLSYDSTFADESLIALGEAIEPDPARRWSGT